MKNYYVYIHIRTDLNEVFYVGMSAINKEGLIYSRAYRSAFEKRKTVWHSHARICPYTVKIIKENLTKEEAFKLEMKLIKKYGRKDLGTGTLINQCDGGAGLKNPGPQLKKKIKFSKKHLSHVYKKAQKPYSISVSAYDKDGNFVKTYESINDACKDVNCLHADITRAVNGKRFLIAGFQWRKYESKIGIGKVPEKRKICKKVGQYCHESLQLLKVWESASEAAKKLNISRTGINNCLKQKSNTSAGYIWKFIE
jgi:hypothetical protein